MLRNRIYFAGVLIVILLSFGTSIYHFVEGWSFVDSFYFSTITLTTIGYGDIAPTTDAGKILTSFYALIGIGVMLYILSSVVGVSIFKQEKNFGKIFSTFHRLRHHESEIKKAKEINVKQEEKIKTHEKELKKEKEINVKQEKKIKTHEKEIERTKKELEEIKKEIKKNE
ncbi:MAG: two pore domain potassium channel family protein [Candidatus Aenigmarchaeota archaeon]|nr:two pore domain potassium channel family protein [Candidatus Aenigmarchaeota archaeon]